MSLESKDKWTLSGFALGVIGTGLALSGGLLTLIIVLNKIASVEHGDPSLSSQLMVALCGLILGFACVALYSSFGIWRQSAKGGALNLGVGIVLLTLGEGTFILLSDFVNSNPSLATFLSAIFIMIGVATTCSGVMGIVAHFTAKR
jgi:hypothetical protein